MQTSKIVGWSLLVSLFVLLLMLVRERPARIRQGEIVAVRIDAPAEINCYDTASCLTTPNLGQVRIPLRDFTCQPSGCRLALQNGALEVA